MINAALILITVIVITLAYRKVKRTARFVERQKENYQQWLHQFDDPSTGD